MLRAESVSIIFFFFFFFFFFTKPILKRVLGVDNFLSSELLTIISTVFLLYFLLIIFFFFWGWNMWYSKVARKIRYTTAIKAKQCSRCERQIFQAARLNFPPQLDNYTCKNPLSVPSFYQFRLQFNNSEPGWIQKRIKINLNTQNNISLFHLVKSFPRSL